ncbi:MAG: GNAT family N-acetyltransferase [Acidisphaera sp.]|nr:GNAT family N-acetyltransferase [Acidisphaera sp.]
MDVFDVHRLDPRDLRDAVALSAEAGWNQTEDDWRVFLARGAVFGIREDRRIVATAASLPYDAFGFVAMVLTTEARRGRGFATRLLRRAIAALTDAGLVAVLDATPAGRPVYQRQGFLPLHDLTRWRCPVVAACAENARTEDAAAPDLIALDAAAFGSRRAFLFNDVLQRLHTAAIVEDDAFVLSRAGRLATHIGPLVAPDDAHATRLLDRILHRIDGPAIIDVPARHATFCAALQARGFAPQRPFTRMALGRDAPFGDPARLFATAGPEFG